MPQAQVDGITIEYEITGDDEPVVVLVSGLGGQLVFWDDRIVAMLVGAGFCVLRFDNRDVGLSSRIPDPSDGGVAYTLDDMTDDMTGLMDVLGIPAAHIVGISMGGLIVQLFAIRHPERVLSLCSIASTCSRAAGHPRPGMFQALLAPPPTTLAEMEERAVRNGHLFSGGRFPVDEERARERARQLWNRSSDITGVRRQWEAIMHTRDRESALHALDIPALVIHGSEDPLVDVSGGEATAAAIPGSRLLVIEGMGHELPEAAWPTVVEAIVDNAARATAR